jgi:hypothetical protein
MSIASTVIVPARVIPRVREGLYSRAAEVSELIDRASMQGDREEDPSVFVEARRRLDATWRLLDAIGWRNTDDEGDVEVDVAHARMLLAAVGVMLPLLAGWLSDLPDRQERAVEQREYNECLAFQAQLQRVTDEVSVIVPADVAVLLRGALYAQFGRAFEDAPDGMPGVETRAGWAGVLERVDGVRAALEVLGWDAPAQQPPVEVVLDRAMVQALEADLDTWRDLASTRSEPERDRAQARAKVAAIERLLGRRS